MQHFAHSFAPRVFLAAALPLAVLAFAPARAVAENIKIGALKSTNVGPVYLAIDKGYFAAEGLTVELVPFESAAPIAVAAAGGSVDFGATSTSGALFSLAGKGELRIISGQYSEAPSFHNFAIAASNHAFDAGLKSYKDLAGHAVGVTQVGSPVHYSLALIAEKFGFDLATIRVLPLQSIPNMRSAVIGNQADAVVINATSINPVIAAGQAHLLGWIGDETPWQAAVTFATPKTIGERKPTVEAFLRAFKKGTRFYHDAYTGAGEQRQDGPAAPEATAIIAKYTGLSPEQVTESIAYVDGEARVDVKDIRHQIAWFTSQGMLKGEIDPDQILDKTYVTPLAGR